MNLVWLAAAVASAILAAVAAFPSLAWGRRARAIVFWPVTALIAVSPLLVPREATVLRLFATFNAVALLAKMYDVLLGSSRSIRPALFDYLAWLPNWACIVYWRREDAPRPSTRQDLDRMAHSVLLAVPAAVLLVLAFRSDWSSSPLLLEHSLKVAALYLLIEPLGKIVAALLRLGGLPAYDPLVGPLFAATPAEFWRRYNTPAGQFFHDDVFRPTGGRRFPLRATLATFAVSALVHEYVFGIILGKVEGYQTAFFMVQGAAVAATLRYRPRGWRAVLAIAATWAFNLLTGLWFFASLNCVFPFYSRPLPRLLPW